jgi:hypothetical protein
MAAALAGAGGAYNLAAGYQKFPSGLIMQWGMATGGSGTVTYNTSCPFTTFVAPLVSDNGSGYAKTTYTSLTSFNWGATSGISWFAIGY